MGDNRKDNATKIDEALGAHRLHLYRRPSCGAPRRSGASRFDRQKVTDLTVSELERITIIQEIQIECSVSWRCMEDMLCHEVDRNEKEDVKMRTLHAIVEQ
ncbi:hypothetical protein HaLaN_26674 [Haematococcus lacustris]|uniref:Uncharacterized protein n=1 Tax=Haematococcus lacustris TaxID=44745 RepID=A0A6A0A6P6_HAELA|nr:hypothetical protein HaLaN_26674 [Haematococcus lacustris]